MAITVSCPACGSRFSLSDDLYRRRVAGSLVKVKCRTCSAEIAVDATEAATKNEAARYPGPPRPRANTQMGLGTPPPPSGLETTAPLPDDDFGRQTLPLNPTVTPLPVVANANAAPVSVDPDSMWADEETIAINVKTKALPKPPAAPLRDDAQELEQIDAEEIPVSSSGAPTLDALTLEAGGAHVPHGRPPADEFLVSFHADGNNAVGAPTIDLTGIADDAETPLNSSTVDVTSFAAEIDPPSANVALEAQELEYRPARGTVPQFDMNAVAPASASPTPSATLGSASSTPLPPRKPVADTGRSDGPVRERKFVIPPQEPVIAVAAPRPRKRPRSRAPLWAALLVTAGAVGAGFGYRERVRSASLAEAPRPVPSPVVNTQAALPAEAVAEAKEVPVAEAATSTAVPEAASAPVAPVAQTVAVAATRHVAPPTVAAVKSTAVANDGTSHSASAAAVPAVEKPVTSEKPVETHNAPPPAAPDTAFDRDAARNALASAASQASSCRKEGDPSGTANLTITFAPSGRVTSAQIQGPPFSGTATGGCIASTMRRASVPAFSGDYVTVSKTIVVQ